MGILTAAAALAIATGILAEYVTALLLLYKAVKRLITLIRARPGGRCL